MARCTSILSWPNSITHHNIAERRAPTHAANDLGIGPPRDDRIKGDISDE